MGAVDSLTFRAIYQFLQKSLLSGEPDQNGERALLPLKCEAASPNTDWQRTWRLARLKGLGPELSSFLLKMTWGILPSKARLAKILPKIYKSPTCQLCHLTETKVPETLEHALFKCSGNNSLPQLLLTLLCSYTPNVTPERVLTLDLNIESHMELPLLWIIASVLSSMLAQRQEGRVCLAKTRAQLEAKCRLLREGKGASLQNAFTLTSIAIQAMFAS